MGCVVLHPQRAADFCLSYIPAGVYPCINSVSRFLFMFDLR